MTSILHTPAGASPPNKTRCCASVHSKGMGSFSYQCRRKPALTRMVDGKELGFCVQHDPERVARSRLNALPGGMPNLKS